MRVLLHNGPVNNPGTDMAFVNIPKTMRLYVSNHGSCKLPTLSISQVRHLVQSAEIKRWPKKAEEILKSNPITLLVYAQYVVKKRWKEVEPIFEKRESHWYHYSASVLDDIANSKISDAQKWKEIESMVKDNPRFQNTIIRKLRMDDNEPMDGARNI